MKLLVTGASGFIGCRLAQILVEQGHSVIATGRSANEIESARVARLSAAGIRVHEGSLLTPGFADTLVAGCEAVIHLAAAQHEGNVPDAYFRDVNVGGTRALIGAAIEAGVRRFVYGSTIGVYGSARDGELDEDSPPRPENIYGLTKYEAEQAVREHAARIEISIARISETFGPGDFRLLKLFKAINSGAFMMLGSGLNLRQVIYVDDLSRALLLATQHPAAVNQTFVFAGNEVMNTRQMVTQIAQALGKTPSSLRIPIWPFRAAAAVFEATFKPFGLQPPLTQRRLDFFTKSFVFSTAKYQKVLGFQPQVPFAQAARATAAWYRDNGLL
ncbi:MAG: NAD-dependent epimerase/dehydratase family protein [Proteobacteria bacterium]|nr:NAD-dependent epimerase/dehydratase family protein [Pseudomonadota bacterium]